MVYQIQWSKSAVKELRKLDHMVARRVLAAVQTLAEDPRPATCKPLKGQPQGTYRIRVGDYRVVYFVDEQVVTVAITRVAHRRQAYREL